MNKKIFPLFSLLLVFALSVTSVVPAFAAAQDSLSAQSDSIRPPVEVPINLQVVYNQKTSQIVLTAAFADKSVIKRGDVFVRGMKPNTAWMKKATLYNTRQIRLSYAIPRSRTGVYCVTVTLNGGSLPGVTKPTPQATQGTASKCVVIPDLQMIAR